MNGRRNNRTPAPPGFSVTDEQPVPEQRRQPIPHLRAFSLETVVTIYKGVGDRVRAVANEHPSREETAREHLPLEASIFPDREEVAPGQTQSGESRKRLQRPLGVWRNEIVHRLRLRRSRAG